ncbi:MAG: ABC-2 family transporter protein [Ilumatobacteraceae bacterium]
MRKAVLTQFQYRAANYFYMIGMIAEPVVYLVVWSTIARANGGSIDGLTPGGFAAYYIVWTLVRNMNIVLTPFAWEERIKEGSLASQLMKPMHPIHQDISEFMGWKVVVLLLWLPIAAALVALFRPTLSPTVLQCVVFFFAIWGAYLIRAIMQWSLGLVTFWTTRVSAIFEAYILAEMLLSGRVFPLVLMPKWFQTLTWYFPFRWSFSFPIVALTGPIENRDLFVGLGMQVAWILFSIGLMWMVWPRAVRRFSSVGG